MNIHFGIDTPDRTTFGDLYCGEVFFFQDQENAFIKTESITAKGMTYNAVNLSCGKMCNFFDGDSLIRLKNKLTVWY